MSTPKKTTNTTTKPAAEKTADQPAKTTAKTRKVKFLRLYIGMRGYYAPEQIAEIPVEFAESAKAEGVVAYVD